MIENGGTLERTYINTHIVFQCSCVRAGPCLVDNTKEFVWLFLGEKRVKE